MPVAIEIIFRTETISYKDRALLNKQQATLHGLDHRKIPAMENRPADKPTDYSLQLPH